MIVPGSNLLGLALGVIQPQVARYYEHATVVTHADGSRSPGFVPGVDVGGSWQPVAIDRVVRLGLDTSKDHATFFTSRPAWAVGRDISPDQFGFNGRRWEVVGKADWISQDGWNAVVLVNIGNDPDA